MEIKNISVNNSPLQRLEDSFIRECFDIYDVMLYKEDVVDNMYVTSDGPKPL